MWMTQYITEIQRQLVEAYGFPKGENGCPQNVPDGAYPMLIEKKLDLVVILNGTIWCCNSITEKGGLKKFQAEARAEYSQKPNIYSASEDKNRMDWLLKNSCIKVGNLYYTSRESLDEAIRATEQYDKSRKS